MIQRLTPTAPPLVQVAPNKFVQLALDFTPPETVLCDFEPVPGQPGYYKLVPRSWEQLVRVDEDLCEKLGLGRETHTMRRLIRSKFVDGSRVSPKIYNVNLSAFFRHMQRCAEDPDFWENPEVREQYKENNNY